VPVTTRNEIDLGAPDFATKAARLPGPATAGTVAVPPARRYAPAGFYPASYGLRWDEGVGEYRIALQGLSWRD
jgi:hypothetical protein